MKFNSLPMDICVILIISWVMLTEVKCVKFF